MSTDSPDLVIAMRLLDHAKLRGFQFRRSATGADGPLVGHRVSEEWHDTIHIEGFSRDCVAWRQRRSSLIVPGNGLIKRRVEGSALTVLNEALTWEMGTMHIPKKKPVMACLDVRHPSSRGRATLTVQGRGWPGSASPSLKAQPRLSRSGLC